MLATTDIHLQRLIALREFGFPLAEQREKEGRLKLDIYMSECRTYGCLLGWWTTTDYAQKDGWSSLFRVPTWTGAGDGECPASAYFGLDDKTWVALFGTEAQGTLSDRRAVLDRLIAERMGVAA